MRFALRRWWPTLALLALGVASLLLLRAAHLQSRDVLQQTIASLDNIAESRRRLLNAYLIHDRQIAGDPTFGQSSAVAELRAAEYALQNWASGRSGIIDFEASAPTSQALLSQLEDYRRALDRLRALLAADAPNAVDLRRRFSEAERAAAVLEAGVHSAVRDSVRADERAYRIRLLGWGLLLLASILGAGYARRALSTSEDLRAETESRLSRLRQVAPVGIVECSPEGGVLAANVMWCSFTGVAEEEWRGRPWWEALHANDQERGRALWTTDAAEEELTTEARLAAGEPGGGAETWVLIRVGKGGADGTGGERRVVTLTDITHRRQVEEQLHHAQRMEAIGRLAGGVAHDFNNLLTSIGGFAGLVLEEVRGDEALESDMVEIQRAAERGRALTRQLLTFSRQDRTNPQVVDARDVVRNLGRMLTRLVSEDVEIEMVPGESPATVFIDANQLEQVVTNLVVNASDAMDARGRIRIGVGNVRVDEAFPGAKSDVQPGDYVLLTVSDTGPGIPPAVRERIFEPFFTTKERGKGTGLGLSTVWGIVRQTGGNIQVHSESGQGTEFRIYLPAAVGAVAAGQPLAAASGPVKEPAGTALVVEDEEAVRRLVRRVLESRGWTILEAANGEEALEVTARRDGGVDLVITDLMMRGMGGAELVERLRSRGVRVPTLFMSGYTESELDLDEGHFLEKPFTPAALVRSVAAAVQAGPLD